MKKSRLYPIVKGVVVVVLFESLALGGYLLFYRRKSFSIPQVNSKFGNRFASIYKKLYIPSGYTLHRFMIEFPYSQESYLITELSNKSNLIRIIGFPYTSPDKVTYSEYDRDLSGKNKSPSGIFCKGEIRQLGNMKACFETSSPDELQRKIFWEYDGFYELATNDEEISEAELRKLIDSYNSVILSIHSGG